jgi:hypothetical protein
MKKQFREFKKMGEIKNFDQEFLISPIFSFNNIFKYLSILIIRKLLDFFKIEKYSSYLNYEYQNSEDVHLLISL